MILKRLFILKIPFSKLVHDAVAVPGWWRPGAHDPITQTVYYYPMPIAFVVRMIRRVQARWLAFTYGSDVLTDAYKEGYRAGRKDEYERQEKLAKLQRGGK
jgi:hypothetical protein